MKIFRVVAERDGDTIHEPGRVSTRIVREDFRYAAETIQDVWDEIAWLRNDLECTIVAVVEEAPAITILTPRQL